MIVFHRKVSIHAPRAGSDRLVLDSGMYRPSVSIHAPRAGSDEIPLDAFISTWRFQSTPPVRGATNFHRQRDLVGWVSIHAPRAGSDGWSLSIRHLCIIVSIHAPRAGSDDIDIITGIHHTLGFNPRPPCGERPGSPAPLLPTWMFQSTPPVRGATRPGPARSGSTIVSIHAPRAGSDQPTWRAFESIWSFNPRPPCGERLRYEP